MVQKYIREVIHKNILEVWKDVENDYKKCFIPNEGTLVNAFYYHLRTRLSAFETDKIRVFTEHRIPVNDKKYFADMVVAKYNQDETDVNLEDIIAVIEFKLKWNRNGFSKIQKDYDKIKQYIKVSKLENCKFYGVSVLYAEPKEKTFLKPSDERLRDRIFEMSADYDKDGNMFFHKVK